MISLWLPTNCWLYKKKILTQIPLLTLQINSKISLVHSGSAIPLLLLNQYWWSTDLVYHSFDVLESLNLAARTIWRPWRSDENPVERKSTRSQALCTTQILSGSLANTGDVFSCHCVEEEIKVLDTMLYKNLNSSNI